MKRLILLLFASVLWSLSQLKAQHSEIISVSLDIEEFKNYIPKSPRFIASDETYIYLISNSYVDAEFHYSINQMPIKLISEQAAKDHEVICFIEVESVTFEKGKANITLKHRNARLIQEENKELRLMASLVRKNNRWVITDYSLEKINISG